MLLDSKLDLAALSGFSKLISIELPFASVTVKRIFIWPSLFETSRPHLMSDWTAEVIPLGLTGSVFLEEFVSRAEQSLLIMLLNGVGSTKLTH